MSVPHKPVTQYSPDYPGYDEGRRNFLLVLGGSASSVLLGAAGCKEDASESGPKKKPDAKVMSKPPTLPGSVKAKPHRIRPPGGLRHNVRPPKAMEPAPKAMEPAPKAMEPDMRPAPTKTSKPQ